MTFGELRNKFCNYNQYFLFCYILTKIDDEGKAYVTHKEIADDTGFSLRQIRQFFDVLEGVSGIIIGRKSGRIGGTTIHIENQSLTTIGKCKVVEYPSQLTVELNKPKNEVEKPKRTRTKKSKPENVEEVQAYLDEKGITDINAQNFFDFYETNGWVQSNKPIKDWKACVRTWENNRKSQALPFVQVEPEKPKEWVDPMIEQYNKFVPWCQGSYPEYANLITFEVFKEMMDGVPKDRFFLTLKRMYQSGFRGTDILKEYKTYI